MLVTGFGGSLLLWLLSLLGQDRVDICHVTGGGRVIELRVAGAAVEAHLRHGDYQPLAFYADNDGDGYGDAYDSTLACEAPLGTVANADDCDDSADFVNPFAVDTCGDSVDEDCSGDDALCAIDYDGWTVTSGRVEAGSTPGTITGRFTFTRVSDTSAATRGGGGCLLADLTGTPDLTSDACGIDNPCVASDALRAAGGSLYCGSPDGSGEPKRCWTRPTDNCSRSAYRTQGEYFVNSRLLSTPTPTAPTMPGSEAPKPAPVSGDATHTGAPVRWMVITCMAIGSNPMGCAGDASQHIYTFGPAFLWTPE